MLQNGFAVVAASADLSNGAATAAAAGCSDKPCSGHPGTELDRRLASERSSRSFGWVHVGDARDYVGLRLQLGVKVAMPSRPGSSCESDPAVGPLDRRARRRSRTKWLYRNSATGVRSRD